MIPSREAADLILGQWRVIAALGAAPRALVWDNEGAVGSWKRGKPVLTQDFQAFRGLLGIGVILLRPRDPESKGIVERANGFLETSFLPGRQFASPADFNAQLGGWIAGVNRRFRRGLGCAAADRVTADRAAMVGLAPLADGQLGWHKQVRLPRDHYVRLGSCDYSVHPSVIGRRVDVHADHERVRARFEGRLVADHARSWAPHQTITDPAHAEAAAAQRAEHRRVSAQPKPARDAAEVEQRALTVYDDLCGPGLDAGRDAGRDVAEGAA
jgi:transposase